MNEAQFLEPPEDVIHRRDCPEHPDNVEVGEGGDCLCREIAESLHEDEALERKRGL